MIIESLDINIFFLFGQLTDSFYHFAIHHEWTKIIFVALERTVVCEDFAFFPYLYRSPLFPKYLFALLKNCLAFLWPTKVIVNRPKRFDLNFAYHSEWFSFFLHENNNRANTYIKWKTPIVADSCVFDASLWRCSQVINVYARLILKIQFNKSLSVPDDFSDFGCTIQIKCEK